ncbi:hypothetical protein FRC04_007242 [Tulasnella sp. 424]|nr:hypothetical protein FRC04_007242 [Tulasnella sp. 424]KAG8976173.1 hypothetical protein FRC05_004422 [Tulasnella sp. 425]
MSILSSSAQAVQALSRQHSTTGPTSAAFTNLPPEVIVRLLLYVELKDILNIRQVRFHLRIASGMQLILVPKTCKHLFTQTKNHEAWIRIAKSLIKDKGVVWPTWALPLTAMPASTIEDLVVRATRLSSLVNTHDWEIEERKSFEAVIQRPWDSPIWLDLVRGRWLLLQLVGFTMELWDLDAAEFAHPIATYVGLEGVINGVVYVEGTNGLEIILSTTSFQVYKFAPDLPYRREVRAVKPVLSLLESFQGYSSVKARRGDLVAFAESAGDRLRACIMDENTRSNAELTFGSQVMKSQRTFDILIQDGVVFVARHRNLELYLSRDIKRVLSTEGTTGHSIAPFQSFSYPNIALIHNPQFHSTIPVYFDAPGGSVALAHFVDDEWQAILVTPQADLSDPTQRGYKIDKIFAIGSGIDPIYGIRAGENGYRLAMLCHGRLTLHYGRPSDTREVPDNGEGYLTEAMERGIDTSHTLVDWELPDFEVDFPRPGCVAIDEAVGICVAAMGSGRIWIGDAVPRVKPERVDVTPLPKKMSLPDPQWPELPPSYYWDKFYSGPLSKSDPIGEVVPGWSTAVDHYWPWRNNPKAYGGILWFVENIMGLPGPATSLLFSTNALFESERRILDLQEYVEIGGKLFWVLTTDDGWVEVMRLVDGTTIDDVITGLRQGRIRYITIGEELISDYMPIEQHRTWYRMFKRFQET